MRIWWLRLIAQHSLWNDTAVDWWIRWSRREIRHAIGVRNSWWQECWHPCHGLNVWLLHQAIVLMFVERRAAARPAAHAELLVIADNWRADWRAKIPKIWREWTARLTGKRWRLNRCQQILIVRCWIDITIVQWGTSWNGVFRWRWHWDEFVLFEHICVCNWMNRKIAKWQKYS